MTRPLVTVVVPTYEHATSIGLAVRSALRQTIEDVAVVVIGDGATPAVCQVVEDLAREDSRVTFVSRPKSASKGEPTRHEVVSAVISPYVCYLGDDDLMLPDHLESMAGLLEEVDFAHPLPVAILPDGSMYAHPTDLSRPDCMAWHQHPSRNAVSLSGASHRHDAYTRLPHGWRTPPSGRWSDHYMWQQWFAQPGLTFATAERCTILKFDSALRPGTLPDVRAAELQEWARRAQSPAFATELQTLCMKAFRDFAIQARLDVARLEDEWVRGLDTSAFDDQIAALQTRLFDADTHLAAERARTAELVQELQHARAESTAIGTELDNLAGTLTMRVRRRFLSLPGLSTGTAPLRRGGPDSADR